MKEKFIIVLVDWESNTHEMQDEIEELKALVFAAQGEVAETFIQKRAAKDAKTVIGSGKVEEIRIALNTHEAEGVIFNESLTGSQIRNLEELLDTKVIDRMMLILDIFAQRAQSKAGRLQVKLAQLRYRLPRLSGMRDYLSRTGGGIGTRGPGEQKLESDRRHILREIHQIESQLKRQDSFRETSRRKRQKSHFPIIALVGYTNAGKSTLLNGFTKDANKQVYQDDMVFATLDTSLRYVTLQDEIEAVMSDTVGFISKLPTQLIEAFKGTLEEVQYADLLLHVVDASNSAIELHMKTTFDILKDLEVLDKPILTVYNKSDRRDVYEFVNLPDVFLESIRISALNTEDIERLEAKIVEMLQENWRHVTLHIPFSDMTHYNYLANRYYIEASEYDETGVRCSLHLNVNDYERYRHYRVKA